MANIDTLRYKNTDYTLGKVPDKTLSISDTPADAKAVGDALANQLTAYPNISTSGKIAHFEDGADNIPMKDVLVHIEPVQAGSGDPSPDNVRAISGWTAAKVTRAGKNLLMPAKTTGTTESNGITFTYYEDGSISATGTATANAYSYAQSGWRLPAGTYRKTPHIQVGDIACGLYVQVKESASSWKMVGYTKNPTFTISEEDAKYDTVARFVIYAGVTVDNLVLNPYIYLASDTDSTYEPYSGQTYSITFPSEAGTVYGGTLDVTSGVLTVEYQKVIFDGTQTGWVASGAGYRYYSPNIFADGVFTSDKNVVCNYLKNRSYTSAQPLFFQSGDPGNHNIYIYNMNLIDSSIVDVASLLAYLTENPLEITYKLATPQTYQLTPQEITSLLGENNVRADTGDSDVEYRADTKMYIDNKIAELQALVLENNGGN